MACPIYTNTKRKKIAITIEAENIPLDVVFAFRFREPYLGGGDLEFLPAWALLFAPRGRVPLRESCL